MSTPSQIITLVAALMNDSEQAVYTNETTLPYFNIALKELQETFQLNNIPVTNVKSAVINVPANVGEVTFAPTVPDPTVDYLPADLVEIRQAWESPENLNQWSPMTRKDFLPQYLFDNAQISQFLIWAWMEQEIKVIPADADNDIKLDYIKNIFTTITLANVDINLDVIGIDSYLHYKVAAVCSMFVGENETRATALEAEADDAMQRTLGISIKSQQAITTRRRPYRAAMKMRGSYNY